MGTKTKVQVLGVGCTKCKDLEERIRVLIANHKLDAVLEKVTDIEEIMKYGIMTTPGLVINGKLMSAGAVPKDSQLLLWLKEGNNE